MITVGFNTFLLASPFTTERTDIIRQIKEWGCDTIEIALEDAAHIDAHAIRRVLDENGLVCGSICAAMGAGRDLRGSEEEQQNALNYLRGVLDVMGVLGCPVLAGPFYSSVGRASQNSAQERQRQWALVVTHMKALAAYAEKLGRRLAIEPINRYETDFINTCEQGLELVEAVGSPAVGLLLDTYHMNIEEKDSTAAIRRAGKHLFHLHACGCDRGAPGGDHINWDGIREALQAVGYSGSLVIESFTPEVTVIAKAASIWRTFEPSLDAIALRGIPFLKGLRESITNGR